MFHVQAPVSGWLDAVQRLPIGSMVKSVDNVQIFGSQEYWDSLVKKGVLSREDADMYFSESQAVDFESMPRGVLTLSEIKQGNPAINTVLRHWYDPGQQFGGNLEANKAKARTFFNTFIDGTFMQYAPDVDFIEEWNEYLATGMAQWELDSRITWATAAAMVWKNEYRIKPGLEHIRLVLCNTAIGNDIPWQFAKIAHDYDAVIGYHPYTRWINGHRWATAEHPNADWLFLSGRWVTMDNDYRSHGYTVDWAFTEAGPYEGAMDGWKSPECLNGSREAYVGAVREWIQDVQETDAYEQGRLLGFALFTVGNFEPWHHFWTQQPELNMLADMIAIEWNPGNEPPPPPNPDEGNLFLNPSFEEGYYNPGGVGELQIPNEWLFSYAPATVPNPHDPHPWMRPEVRVLSPTDLPPDEQEQFILDGTHTLKMFKGSGSWWGVFKQLKTLEPGTHTYDLRIFADLVKGYTADGEKIWADDPEGRDGLVRIFFGPGVPVLDWTSLVPGEWNVLLGEIEITETQTHDFAVSLMLPFPLANNGVFIDDWYLAGEEIVDMGLNEHIWNESIETQCVSLNPQAALQAAMYTDNFVPVGTEHWTTFEGKQYAYHAGEQLGTGERRVYIAEVPFWNNVWWIGDPSEGFF